MKITIDLLNPSEMSQEFLQGMANRMDLSFMKYGRVADAKGKVDELASLRKRLQRYEETRNTEWLMDVANIAMIEFMHHPESFRATDSHESPGLKLVTGEVIHGEHSTLRPPEPKKLDLDHREGDFYQNRRGD
jgi:hypothetical protein